MWGWLWWLCLAAAAAGAWATPANPLSREQEGLHYEPFYHPLPTNLTIRPLSGRWHMNFTMKVEKSSSSVCVHMESTKTFVKVQSFSGYCSNGEATKFHYLKCSLKTNTWNTLEVRLADDGVLLQEPDGRSVKLSDVDAVPPPHSLLAAVTEVSGVEAEEECANNCPVNHYAATELDKKKVKEWRQESPHFYFRPAGPSSRLQYEVQCETGESTVYKWEAEIQLGAEGTTAGWHLVELEQRQSRATVRLNNKVLQDTELPGICTTRTHVIWVVEGGSFSFKFTPPGATERTERGAQRTTEETTESPLKTMHIIVFTALSGIGLVFIVTVFVGVIVYILMGKPKTINNSTEDPSTYSALPGPELPHAVDLQPPHREKKMTAGSDSKPKLSSTAPRSNTLKSTTVHHESEALLPPLPPEPLASASAATATGSDAAQKAAPPPPEHQGEDEDEEEEEDSHDDVEEMWKRMKGGKAKERPTHQER